MSGVDCKWPVDNRGAIPLVIFVHLSNKQHTAVTLALGGLYPAGDVVQAVLRPQDGEKKAILDLGK
jgi:hypothetical protein